MKKWRLGTSQPEIIHSGQKTTKLSVGSDVMITVDVKNLQLATQKFTVIVQVKNNQGIVVDLREFQNEVDFEEGWDVTTIRNPLWIPAEKGIYQFLKRKFRYLYFLNH